MAPELRETILQFGSGKFLRGFADLFVQQANDAGQEVGRVVVAQTTGDRRARLLTQQGGRYHVVIRGLEAGRPVERIEEVRSISRALVAAEQWPELLAVARSPALRYVVSNTAEAGYDLDPADRADRAPPRAFPAKLLVLLKERFEAGQPGLTIIPCELFEHNAQVLRGIVLKLAASWQLPPALLRWVEHDCAWLSTLVDRIVCEQKLTDPRLEGDELYVVGEPYALWAIEEKQGAAPFFGHPAIRRAADVQPFFLRKVRILNAAHTALVSRAVPRNIPTVLEAVTDAAISSWLEQLLFDEIVPTVRDRVEDAEGFARLTLERFRNPFLEHKIRDILVYHDAKVRIRLEPTRAEFAAKFGRTPPLLNEAIAFRPPA
jgi:tagaturonate reductase